LRYSELHCDALRYAREGSTSGEVLTFAQETLQVAFSEVVLMKQQIVSLHNVMNMVLQTTVRNYFFSYNRRVKNSSPVPCLPVLCPFLLHVLYMCLLLDIL